METMDLDIDNYNLKDVLNLFGLKHDFDEEQLKHAKRVALKTHPDKSGLDKNIFMFFVKAYNMLVSVYKFKNKTEKEVVNKDYTDTDIDHDDRNVELLKMTMKGKSRDDFNSWFNEMFTKSNIKKKDNGYGSWLKSDEDLTKSKARNMTEFNKIFNKKKEMGRQLILKDTVKDMSYYGKGTMIDETESVYSSDIFSKLKYEDLKKAHKETVVPVTEEDFTNKKRFDNLDQYLKYRESQKGNVLDLTESKNILHNKSMENEKLSTQRAYNLLMEDKTMQERNKLWWKNLKLLK
jgi:hypothetical protein